MQAILSALDCKCQSSCSQNRCIGAKNQLAVAFSGNGEIACAVAPRISSVGITDFFDADIDAV